VIQSRLSHGGQLGSRLQDTHVDSGMKRILASKSDFRKRISVIGVICGSDALGSVAVEPAR
jgi:hypothetical protein